MGIRWLHHGSLACLVVLSTLVSFLCCGGSPAAPDEQPVLAIVSPVDVLRVGESADMTLRITFSDGRSTTITPTWSTDRPDVIHVKPLSASRQGATGDDAKTGVIDHILFARVTGLAPGSAIVSAETGYGTCGRPIRVVEE